MAEQQNNTVTTQQEHSEATYKTIRNERNLRLKQSTALQQQ
jgi:hypothetical protein